MMDNKVPMRNSVCKGTGTVMVESSVDFCMMTWLPFCRFSAKPCLIKKTSRPESLRSFPNVDLQRSNVNFGVEPVGNLVRVCCFKEQLDSFFKVAACFFNRIPLAGNI
jgi:hypothetical protein